MKHLIFPLLMLALIFPASGGAQEQEQERHTGFSLAQEAEIRRSVAAEQRRLESVERKRQVLGTILWVYLILSVPVMAWAASLVRRTRAGSPDNVSSGRFSSQAGYFSLLIPLGSLGPTVAAWGLLQAAPPAVLIFVTVAAIISFVGAVAGVIGMVGSGREPIGHLFRSLAGIFLNLIAIFLFGITFWIIGIGSGLTN